MGCETDCGQLAGAIATPYIAGRLQPGVAEIVLTDSALACLRCANTAFDMWSALGRPMGQASAQRASRVRIVDLYREAVLSGGPFRSASFNHRRIRHRPIHLAAQWFCSLATT